MDRLAFFLSALICVIATIITFIYRKHILASHRDRIDGVLTGLILAEEKAFLSKPRIAVGFGGCRDVVVNLAELFHNLNASLPENPYHVETVTSKRDLENLAAYFYRHGAAAERYVSNQQLFEAVKLALSQIPNSRKSELVAGAPATMAKRLAMYGADVLLAAQFSKISRDELPNTITIAGETIETDDLHVIMEYKVNEVMGPYIAPRDNRLIVHRDEKSPYLGSLEDMIHLFATFKASLVIISGLQMMDNFPFKEGEQEARLKKLGDFLLSLPLSTKIHLEMASFTDIKLLQQIIEYVIPHVDSMGMNEQELPNIISAITAGTVTNVSDSTPRIAAVLDDMRVLYNNVYNHDHRSRAFSRLHVHTLAYQAILTNTLSDWKQTMSATAKASLTAHRYTCNVEKINADRAKLIVDDSFRTSLSQNGIRVEFKTDRPVACWKEGNTKICVAPVLVCTKVHKTAGAGDNISSSGLLLQV